ncbi:MAG: murein L,D-transpeptidase catalytic domain family protein [Hyphomonas sp.]
MIRLSALILLVFSVFTGSAVAKPLDPEGKIRPELLERALAAREARSADTPDTGALVVVDYSLHSSKPRVYVVNLETGAVTALRTAHGKGSDPDHDGFLDSFSDVPGSGASPEGLYRTAEEYYGAHGRSLRLDGLDESNANARSRAIVIHSAVYAEPEHVKKYGKLGRSNGCIVFSADDLSTFLDAVPKGTLLYVGK